MAIEHGVNKLVSDSGNELDLENKTIPTGMQMGGVDIATTANIISSFVLGDAEDGVTVGADKFVYLDDSDGKVKEALSTDITSDEQVYFTVAGSLANGFPVSVVTETYQVFGLTWETGQTPTAGQNIYLSASEAGNVTHTAPTDGILLGELIETVGDSFVARLQPNIGKNALGTDNYKDSSVTEAKLSASVQAKLNDTSAGACKVTLAHDSAGTVELIPASELESGDEVWEIRWYLTTAFDGTAPTVEIGVSGDTDAVLASGTIDLKGTTDVLNHQQVRYVMAASEAVNLTYVADSSTAGSCDIYAHRVKL